MKKNPGHNYSRFKESTVRDSVRKAGEKNNIASIDVFK